MRRPKVGGQTVRAIHLPAPTGGLDTVAPAAAMHPSRVLWAYNVIPSERGLRSRLGFREWCTGLTGGAPVAVREVLPFQGATANDNRLFVTTTSGIWDVTDSSAAPSLALAFATAGGSAGWGVSQVFVTAAGHFLLYADEVNGLHMYTASTEMWAAVEMGASAGQLDGVDPRNIVHVAAFKSRLWLTERDSSRAWYLDAGAIAGTATSFDFGRQFRAGGSLVGLWNWTYDGGAGLDDSLVAVSTGGDVAIYQGTDPDDALTFGLKGTWSISPPPAGRRIATDVGGDLLLLSRSGIRPASVLVSGAAPEDKGADATGSISNLFAQLASERGGLRGWALHIHPTDNALLVTVPQLNDASEQLAFHLPTRSWWRYRSLPIVGAGVYNGALYFGTLDGRVCVNDGWVDDVKLSDSSDWDEVACGFLSAYQSLGGNTKLEMFRPTFLSDAGNVAAKVTARYNYDTSEPTHLTDLGGGGASAWDTAVWDTAVWGGAETLTSKVQGATGMGREVAVAVQWNAIGKTTLAGVEVHLTRGGLL